MEKNIFDQLKELQDVLYQKFKLEDEISEIPKALSTKQEMVKRLKKNYIDKNRLLNKKNEHRAYLSSELNKKLKEKLESEELISKISSQREYETLGKQISDLSEVEQKFRKSLKKEENDIAELEQTLKNQEILINQNEEELKEEEKKVDSLIIEKEKELEKLKRNQNEIIPGIDEQIIFKFDRIIRNKEGKGIVSINNQICTGCNMQLPAQFANNIRTGTEINFCPYCSRILYFEQSEEIQEDFAFAEADAGGLADSTSAEAGDLSDIFNS